MNSGSLIVLLTDFGTEHWYDAAMKGEILRRVPEARILDLSHDVPRQSIETAAFILHCAIDSFAPRTIFCCVVDPGVGGKRRTLVGRVGDYAYVGPDNGLITPLLNRADELTTELHEIKSPTFRNKIVSATFHGRDVFAPAAARMYLGDDPRMAGPRVTDPIRLDNMLAQQKNGTIEGKIMLIDHFGNAITNIDRHTYGERLGGGKFELKIRELALKDIDPMYSHRTSGQPLCYWGSNGFLEIAINFGSAADTYGLHVGDPALVRLAG